MLQVPKSWVYEAPERRIPHVKLGGYVRFEREQLDTWLVPICAGSCCYSPRSVVPRVYRASVTDLQVLSCAR
jgi:excisionase family DNA binding protein